MLVFFSARLRAKSWVLIKVWRMFVLKGSGLWWKKAFGPYLLARQSVAKRKIKLQDTITDNSVLTLMSPNGLSDSPLWTRKKVAPLGIICYNHKTIPETLQWKETTLHYINKSTAPFSHFFCPGVFLNWEIPFQKTKYTTKQYITLYSLKLFL